MTKFVVGFLAAFWMLGDASASDYKRKKIRVGSEFNFASEEITRAGHNSQNPLHYSKAQDDARARFAAEALTRCPQCFKVESKALFIDYSLKIVHPADWWFAISLDPWVIEVQMAPSTIASLEERKNEINLLIFGAAAASGLESVKSGGQIHIDRQDAFGNDPMLIRNFLVDWIFHSRLLHQLFGGSRVNAPTLDMLPQRAAARMEMIIDILDREVFGVETVARSGAHSDPAASIMTQTIRDTLASARAQRSKEAPDWSRTIFNLITEFVYEREGKHHDLNFAHSETVEFRAMPEAQTAEMFIAIASLLEGRINHLQGMNKLLPFRGVGQFRDPREMRDVYLEFTKQAELSWKDAKSLILSEYQAHFWKIERQAISYPMAPPKDSCQSVFSRSL